MHLQHLSVHRKYVATLLAGVLLVALGSFVALLAPHASANQNTGVKEAYSWGVGEYDSEDGCDGFWEGF